MVSFLLQLTLTWSLFALLYTLLLRRETFFQTNRHYLLTALALGFLLPLFSRFVPGLMSGQGKTPVLLLSAVEVGWEKMELATSGWAWWNVPCWIWLAGSTVLFLRLLWGLAKLLRWGLKGQKARMADGCLLIRSNRAQLPFSFFRWIFVPSAFQPAEEDQALILAHERAHARHWHSADVLAIELLCAVFWWHPLAYWYRQALRTVHEYQADAHASGLFSKKQYGLLLIRQAQSGLPLVLANHFLQSPLKQRLIMLTKKATVPANRWKYSLPPLGLVLLALFFQQLPATAQKTGDLQEVQTLDQEPGFPGGQEAMAYYIANNLKYPEDARQSHSAGTVIVTFIVREDGSLSDIRTKTHEAKLHASMEQEAARVVAAMPKWVPGKIKNRAVASELCLPIRFKLE